MTRHPLTRCAHCRFRPIFHRKAGAVILRGRLMRWNGKTQWLCSVCIGSLPATLRRVWFGKKEAA